MGQDEEKQVNAWRFARLVEANFPFHAANLLAESDVDLHEAVELTAKGCPPELALEILR